MTPLPTSAIDSARLLADWGEARGWQGSDPYEGLNATRFVAPLAQRPLGRRILIQAVKRSPLDLRPVLGIAPRPNAAAMADVVSAYAIGGPDLAPDWEQRLDRALAMLMALRSPDYELPCWGYHFDVQTRICFYPASCPNVIASSFAGFALLDAFERTGDEELLQNALGIGRFYLDHIPQTESAPGAWFSYLPFKVSPIHNANLLACALLARVSSHAGRDDLAAAAQAGIDFTVSRQRDDGSWPYGDEPYLGWVDNFHTGYVLDCLMACERAGLEVGESVIRRGLDFARDELFLADGAPKYFPDAVHPIDIQCVAQAIKTFSIAAERWPEFAEQAERTWEYGRLRMRRSDGAFAFQRGRWGLNRIAHMRWGQTPMLRALAQLTVLQRETAGVAE